MNPAGVSPTSSSSVRASQSIRSSASAVSVIPSSIVSWELEALAMARASARLDSQE